MPFPTRLRRDRSFLFDTAQTELGLLPLETATTTAIYTKSRVANKAQSPGGTAKSRGAIVNAGGM